jgi:hypothetical protein
MADEIVLNITPVGSPFVLTAASETPFVLQARDNSTITLTLGASLVGGVNLTGPSSIKGLSGFVASTPQADEIVIAGLAPYAFTVHLGDSGAVAIEAATAQTIYSVKRTRAGVTNTIGTFTFAIGSTIGVLAMSDPVINKSDLITIQAPHVQDATLGDIAFLLAE